jgi:hypothetical protein
MDVNYSSTHYTTDATDAKAVTRVNQPILLAFNYAIAVVNVVILLSDVIAVKVLQLCKRMPQVSRRLSISYFLSDASANLLFLIHQFIMYFIGINNDITNNSRIISASTGYMISSACIAALALERVFALKMNLRYSQNHHKITYLAIILIWFVHVCSSCLLIAFGLKHYCSAWKFSKCDMWEATQVYRFTVMCFIVIYQITLAVSYAVIYKVASRHARAIDSMKTESSRTTRVADPSKVHMSQRQFILTTAILKVVLSFVLLYAPINIHLFLMELNVLDRESQIRRLFHAASYVCVQINSFVSLSVYVGKFEECKMHMYFILSKLFKSYKQRGEDMRIRVYNIVVSSDVKVL